MQGVDVKRTARWYQKGPYLYCSFCHHQQRLIKKFCYSCFAAMDNPEEFVAILLPAKKQT